ncbi:MAG: M20/M25/M40 family metallo-hydrolase [Anaerolineales bacterium]|jgi:acetylornithine deacetylase/succinyl-diaminopimelate desuccinylase-like protein|nr:M20/M25/M40 family metallo-hydrolase [Anaerolineales bacterium]
MNEPLFGIVKQVLALAGSIQQVPAPTFAEQERAAYVRQVMQAEGLWDVQQDETGNVYGRLVGRGAAAPLIVSAHLDTVFPAGTDLTLQHSEGSLSGPGIGDNSLGVAGLFGLLWMLRQADGVLPGDIWLVANVGEEGLGDLCGMKAVVKRFGAVVSAYLVLEGMSLGQIYHRGLGVQRYRITFRAPGGHSWANYGRPSAIHHLARLITSLENLPVPAAPRSSLNVGVIAGGTTVNTIAAEAHLELDLRSEAVSALEGLAGQVEELVAASNQRTEGVTCDAEIIGLRPAGGIAADHPLVSLASGCLREQGISPVLGIGSTDANIPLSQGLPAVCVGLTTGSGAHTLRETIQTAPLESGLRQLLALAQGALHLSGS